MFASFDYQLSKDEYVRGLRILAISIALHDRHRNLHAVGQLAMLGLILGIATALNPGSFEGAFLALALVVLGGCALQTRRLRHWHGLTFNPATADAKVTMDENGVVKRHRISEHHWSWDDLRQVHELPEAVVLQFADWHSITLPDRLWATPNDRSDLVRNVRDRSINILPDLPMATRRTRAAFNLLSLGSFGAALLALGVPAALTFVFAGPILRIIGHDNSGMAIFQAIFVTTALILAIVVGRLTNAGLANLNKSHPRVASATAAMLIAAAGAGLLMLALQPHCGC